MVRKHRPSDEGDLLMSDRVRDTPIRTSHLPSRREFLTVGSLAIGGLGLSELLAARAASAATASRRPDTSVILLYLHGGPSQLETYDLKPDAPSDYRGGGRPGGAGGAGGGGGERGPRQ